MQPLKLTTKRIVSVKGKNSNLKQIGKKSPQRLMFEVVGAGAVSRRPRMSSSLKNYTSGENGLKFPGINALFDTTFNYPYSSLNKKHTNYVIQEDIY